MRRDERGGKGEVDGHAPSHDLISISVAWDCSDNARDDERGPVVWSAVDTAQVVCFEFASVIVQDTAYTNRPWWRYLTDRYPNACSHSRLGCSVHVLGNLDRCRL